MYLYNYTKIYATPHSDCRSVPFVSAGPDGVDYSTNIGHLGPVPASRSIFPTNRRRCDGTESHLLMCQKSHSPTSASSRGGSGPDGQRHYIAVVTSDKHRIAN
jgi:hypothetical protein